MDFGLHGDVRALQQGTRALLDRACPPSAVRAAWTSPTGRSESLWRALAEAGLLGIAAPPDLGGLGLDEEALIAVLEECGRAALPEPVAEVAAGAVPLLFHAAPEAARELIPAMIEGRTRVALVLPGRTLVPDAHVADLLLVAHGGELHAVPRAAAAIELETSVDGARRLFRVTCAPTAATRIAGDAAAAITETELRLALGAAAELLGLAGSMLDRTVAYAKLRTQFGQPIGAFQAVKHQLADALIALELARPTVLRAAWSMRQHSACSGTHVSIAKAFASDAGLACARAALQVHGAIGYSFEYDLHLWMKRAWALAAAWGDAAHHREQVARAVLDTPLDNAGDM